MTSIALLAAPMMNVYAQGTVQGTTATFDKYLVMEKNANVPNATFDFTVSTPTEDEMNSVAILQTHISQSEKVLVHQQHLPQHLHLEMKHLVQNKEHVQLHQVLQLRTFRKTKLKV